MLHGVDLTNVPACWWAKRSPPSSARPSRSPALPSEAREEALFVADRAYADAMLCRGQDVAAAAKWVELVMTAVRLLVAQIDSSGGRYIKVLPH